MSEQTKAELYSLFKELISEAIQTYATENSQINMASAVAQEQLTTYISKYLRKFITECEDEIDSLWFMLDEIKGSEDAVKSLGFKEQVDGMVGEHIALLKMMQNSKGDA
jgi:ferritin